MLVNTFSKTYWISNLSFPKCFLNKMIWLRTFTFLSSFILIGSKNSWNNVVHHTNILSIYILFALPVYKLAGHWFVQFNRSNSFSFCIVRRWVSQIYLSFCHSNFIEKVTFFGYELFHSCTQVQLLSVLEVKVAVLKWAP